MTRNEYQAIRARLSFQQRYVFIGIFLLADASLFALGLYLLASSNPFAYIGSQFLFAVIAFHNFAIVHECGHGTAASSTWLNTITGHYCSLYCFMPYFPWKYIHTEHHTWTGNLDRDPTLKAIRDYRKDQRLKNGLLCLAWRTWVPLLAFMQHLVLWSYPLMLFQLGRLRGKRLVSSLASILLLPLTYVSLYCLWPQLFNIPNFALAFVIYLILVELINFPHHLGTEIHRTTKKGKRLLLWEQTRIHPILLLSRRGVRDVAPQFQLPHRASSLSDLALVSASEGAWVGAASARRRIPGVRGHLLEPGEPPQRCTRGISQGPHGCEQLTSRATTVGKRIDLSFRGKR